VPTWGISDLLDERSIKAAVIDRLFDSGMLNDAVLINEMVYANWTRRADLAVANGHLHAFEIKSDFDSLRRLEGQIEIYLERFDKLTLVVSPKFLDVVLASTPSRVAVWSVFEENGCTKIQVIRTGRKAKVQNRLVLIDYLLRDELYHFLVSRKVTVRRSDSRSYLIGLAETQPVAKLRAYVLEALKVRYQKSYSSFVALRKESTSPTDLVALRKDRDSQLLPQVKSAIQTSPHVKEVTLALSRLFPSGEIPAEIPTSIFVRNRIAKRRKNTITN
jgi:hypothetical protein